ncbi:MAG: glycosyltransferase family 1 protein [Magnetococcales bacterium]|nr:glycosyltransferase family 1 protein [Magnetococcales bacterium]
MQRVLIIQHPDYLYYHDLSQACRTLGLEPLLAPCASEAELDALLADFDRLHPDWVLNHPMVSPLVGRLGRLKNLPVAHWGADKILNLDLLNRDLFSSQDRLFLTYREDVAKFRALGVTSHYLLNCHNLAQRDTPSGVKTHAISFVGSAELGPNNYFRLSMDHWAQRARALSPDHVALFELLRSLFLQALAGQDQATRRQIFLLPRLVAELFREFGPLFQTMGLTQDYVTLLLGKEAASRQRQSLLASLPHIDVFGPEDWQSSGLENITWHGPVRQYDGSGAVFAASRINLHLGRIYCLDGLSDRVFNIPSSGGFLLANRHAALTEVLEEDREVALFEDAQELNDKVRFYLANDTARETIAARGRQRVRNDHGFAQRVREILKYL